MGGFMKTKHRYFNFPICLLNGFLLEGQSKECLDDISDYAIYSQSQNFVEDDLTEQINSACKFFGLTLGNVSATMKNGKLLYDSIDARTPKVGINLSVWWDFYKNDKTEFEKVCFLGHLAIKSIVQNKSYTKIDNKYWLSRMSGLSKSVSLEMLPPEILRYFNEYQTKKIKHELVNNWGLVTYSRYTKGFYVSYKLTLEQLVFEAEKRRKSNKEKQQKKLENEAVKKAHTRLGL